MRHLVVLLLAFIVLPCSSLAQQGGRLGGYGELHYNDVVDDGSGENPPGTLDFHRFILFAGYQFNDWVSFHSELEVEHTLIEAEEGDETAEGGEVALEQAYVDLRPSRSFGVRAGLVLVPVGIINPVHEPPTFNGVERPNVDGYLIPTTWRESGVGVFGQFQNGLAYEAYLLAGLDPTGISGVGGIEDAPQDGFESSVDNVALTARLDYQASLRLSLGGSIYHSGLASDARFGDALDGVRFTLLELHGQYQRSGFQTRGVLVYSALSNAETLNSVLGTNAGSSQLGGYLEVGYDVLSVLASAPQQQLVAFGRFEPYTTQFTTPSGTPTLPAATRQETTVGLTYKPTSQVALKADFQWLYDDGTKRVRQLNLGVGYNF